MKPTNRFEDFTPQFAAVAERKRILGLAGAIHGALSAADRRTLTIGQLEMILDRAELLASAILSADVDVVVRDLE